MLNSLIKRKFTVLPTTQTREKKAKPATDAGTRLISWLVFRDEYMDVYQGIDTYGWVAQDEGDQ